MFKNFNLLEFIFESEEVLIGQLKSFFIWLHVKIYLGVLIILNAILWYFVGYINDHVSQGLIFLHYNVDFGVNLIGEASQLYVVPLIGMIIISFNSLISFLLIKKENFNLFSHLLFVVAILCHFFLLASMTAIYLINFR
jgi:hypothetical protein